MIMNLVWLFFAYSFFGWTVETVYAAIKKKHFVNRGVVNGPLLVLYVIGACLMTFGLRGLSGFWLFLLATIYATVIEWVSGHLIERYYHERWWNYSKRLWNLDGYICLTSSLMKGALGFLALTWGNSLVISVVSVLPKFLTDIILIGLIVVLAIDVISSITVIAGLTGLFDNWITEHINRRLRKAYPEAETVARQEKTEAVFAYGCGFYKIVLLFFAGAFLGDDTNAKSTVDKRKDHGSIFNAVVSAESTSIFLEKVFDAVSEVGSFFECDHRKFGQILKVTDWGEKSGRFRCGHKNILKAQERPGIEFLWQRRSREDKSNIQHFLRQTLYQIRGGVSVDTDVDFGVSLFEFYNLRQHIVVEWGLVCSDHQRTCLKFYQIPDLLIGGFQRFESIRDMHEQLGSFVGQADAIGDSDKKGASEIFLQFVDRSTDGWLWEVFGEFASSSDKSHNAL